MTLLSVPPGPLSRHLASVAPVRLFAVLWGGLAVVAVARHLDIPPTLQVVGLAAVVAAASLHQRPSAAVLAAGLGWLVVTGFVVHPYGQLAWSGPADLVRLGVLGLAATAGHLVGPHPLSTSTRPVVHLAHR